MKKEVILIMVNNFRKYLFNIIKYNGGTENVKGN